MSFKVDRVQQLLFKEISTLIVMRKIKDPRVDSRSSVLRIKVAKDTTCATVFISGYMSIQQLENTVSALNHARGFIQREIAKKYKLKNTPRLTFKMSDALHCGDKVLEELARISNSTRAK